MDFETAPAAGVAAVTVDGGLSMDSVREALLRLAHPTAPPPDRVLLDFRPARGSLSSRDVFQLVRVLTDHPKAFGGRIALLDNYKRYDKAEFFCASAAELGFEFQAFLDPQDAADWLQMASRVAA
jgi:hypothetical protein